MYTPHIRSPFDFGVDGEGEGGVVGAGDFKTVGVVVEEGEASGDGFLLAVGFLVDLGCAVGEGWPFGGEVNLECAVGGEGEFFDCVIV